MLKTTFHTEEPKTLIYRDYKTFSLEKFSSELFLKLESQETMTTKHLKQTLLTP